MTRLIVGLACMACACLSAPALAAVHTDDAAATHAYLHAAATYEAGADAEVGATAAAIETRVNEISGECPSALTYAPRDATFGDLGYEAITTAVFAGLAPTRSMLLRLSEVIAHLRWSDPRLSRLVHEEVSEERGILGLALPDVCADIAAWRASAYAALPPSAAGFLARVRAIESSSYVGPSEELRKAVIQRLLRPYEGPTERRAAKRIERLEAAVSRRLTAATVAAEAKLAAAWGVSML